ncbi:hypothetical protein ACJX0J_032387, partial [Zea mays]
FLSKGNKSIAAVLVSTVKKTQIICLMYAARLQPFVCAFFLSEPLLLPRIASLGVQKREICDIDTVRDSLNPNICFAVLETLSGQVHTVFEHMESNVTFFITAHVRETLRRVRNDSACEIWKILLLTDKLGDAWMEIVLDIMLYVLQGLTLQFSRLSLYVRLAIAIVQSN